MKNNIVLKSKLILYLPHSNNTLVSDVEEPTELIQRIRQLYLTRERQLSPFPWCDLELNDIFTRPTIVRQDKTRGTAAEQVTSITGVFKPHSGCSKPRTVLIEGETGMGKTTYCQKVVYDWANGQETDASFPKIKLVLLLKCHDMSGNIWEAIDDQLLPKDIEEEERENFFKYIRANQSQVLLVLDGLDEAPSNLMKIFSDLVESRELSKSHIILTSRQEGSVKIRKYCDTLLQIQGFAPENSHNYIKHYFKDLKAQGQNLLKDIEQNIELGELIVNPLFTAMLCLFYEDLEGGLPLSKTQLYLEITECILKRFCQKQGLSHNNDNLTEVYKEELEQLGRIAWETLEKDKMHIEEGAFTATTTRKSPLFEFLSVQSNSSKRRSHTCYQFSHKSFQEFFAGLYLSDQILKGETDFEGLLSNKQGNLKSLEPVLLFTAGILSYKSEKDACSLLKMIIKKINHFQNFSFLNFYLYFAVKCISECSTENSRLRSQMINLLGKNLELQEVMIFDNSFPIKLFVEALQVNSTLTNLMIPIPLSGHQYVKSLADMLRVNKTLTKVIIRDNFISAYGVQQLIDALQVNTTLLELALCGNAWDNNGASILAGYLKRNKTLTALHLIRSDIGDVGATALAEVLWTNTTLNSLDLWKNPGIGNPSVTSLCKALKVNKTLSTLNLSETGISDAGVLSLVEVLKTNTSSLTSLSLSEIKISHHSVKSIAEVLRVNSTLKELKFEGNNVGSDGAELIAESLKANTTLKILILSRNNIKEPCGGMFSDALKVNGTLESLTLAENDLGVHGAQLLSEGLKVNTSLRHLDLSGNSIGTKGAELIAETIRVHASMTGLKLSWNGIGDAGANKVSEALKVNVHLKELDLSFNAIGAAGAESIAEALKSNATLTVLDLDSNVIGDNGVQSLCEALKTNATLTNLIVSNNNIHSAGAQAFDKLQGHNNTLKKVTLIMNNISDLGDHGDQEFNEVPMVSVSSFPTSHDLSLRFTDQGSFDILVSKETLMLPQQ